MVWEGEGEDRKGQFVNLHKQSNHWVKGSTKMETLLAFALDVERDDVLFLFDIKSGFHHFYLHPDMQYFLLFHYGGRFYQCIAMPFGLDRSGLLFTKILRPLVRFLREKCGYRVIAYIDDFLVALSPSVRAVTEKDVKKAYVVVEGLLRRLGFVRHTEKRGWVGVHRIDHLGAHLDTSVLRVFVIAKKVAPVRRLSRRMLLAATGNQRLVSANAVRHLCGVAVSVSLGYPLARFYKRSLFSDLAGAERKERGKILRA